MVSKKGQGLSLTTIIVAALALIVLVVLVVIFTGNITNFERGLSEEGKTELIKMRISYGNCQPTSVSESEFDTALGLATTPTEKELAKDDFMSKIETCKARIDENICKSTSGCKWS